VRHAGSVLLGQAAEGGERPVVCEERRNPSARNPNAKARPASASVHAPAMTGVCGFEPTWLDVQAAQCCGVLMWQTRSWCPNAAVTRQSA